MRTQCVVVLSLVFLSVSTVFTSCEKSVYDPFGGHTVGKGSKDYPYPVNDFIALSGRETSANSVYYGLWVQGYIVGCYNDTTYEYNLSESFTTDLNLFIAAEPNETDPSKMLYVPISIPFFTNTLGLQSNPSNFGKEIIVHGNLSLSPLLPGAKMEKTDGFWFLNGERGADPADGEAVYSETFATAISDWKSIPNNFWSITGGNAVASSNQTNVTDTVATQLDKTPSYFVSSAINIPNLGYVTLSFDALVSYVAYADKNSYQPAKELSVWVSSVYDGTNFVESEWTQLAISCYPTSPSVVTTLYADLTSFTDKTVYVAFKYQNVNWCKYAGKYLNQTWKIKNLVIQ